MKTSNILGSAIRATDNMLQETMLGEGINFLNETGCSLFFITSSISSMVSGNKNREKVLIDTKEDIVFQKELQRQKEQHEDAKENEEKEFKLKLKLIQRQHSRMQNCLRLQDEKKLNELEMLFNGWPLASSVGGLLDHIKSTSMFTANLNFVIGRVQSETEKDPISVLYRDPAGMSMGITDMVIDTLVELGITKERLHLMNDKCQLYGGALFANIFAVMHSLPVIVVSPIVYENKIHINIGCWNQDSSFPYQEEVFCIDYDVLKAKTESQYLYKKKEELVQVLVAIAAVFDETYRLSEGLQVCSRYANYAVAHDIVTEYPYIINFAIREYYSLLASPQSDLIKDCDSALRNMPVFNSKHFEDLKQKVDELVKPLNR